MPVKLLVYCLAMVSTTCVLEVSGKIGDIYNQAGSLLQMDCAGLLAYKWPLHLGKDTSYTIHPFALVG